VKVCIGSPGRFHGFDLARQMSRLGHLEQLYTAYPRYKVDGLRRKDVSTFPWLVVPTMVAGRVGFGRLARRLNLAAIESYDNWMAHSLRPCDVFHSLSSFAQRSHRVARERYGAATVCDRAGAHVLGWEEILREEHDLQGVHFEATDARVVERELDEYEYSDLITVPSRFALSTFVQRGVPLSKLRQVAYGVDLAMFHPEPHLHGAQREDGRFRILFVGAISLRKGVQHLLEAVRRSAIPAVDVWLVGPVESSARPVLARYEGLFRHLGIIPRAELHRYYSQASVFVLPSLAEGIALVQAQAMACGVPVIATANAGAEDLYSDGVEGFIVPIRSPEAIRDKIVYLYENPAERQRMAAAALARVRSLGGWNSYGERMAACYEVALRERSAGARSDADSLH
jgi:glycosyltransferase involved in cell wall biosynthesis